MKKILIISNLISYTYNFRKEIIQALISNDCEVTVLADNDDDAKAELLRNMGCTLINIPFNGKGTSIKQDSKVLFSYIKYIKKLHPDMIFTYTIKPNLYGGIAAKLRRARYVPMITGLGEVEKKGKLQGLLLGLHRFVMPYAVCVFFQNQDNISFFNRHKIKTKRKVLIPGSGINLDEHHYEEYPQESGHTDFAFIGRLTPAKGIEQYLDAAEYYHRKDDSIRFHVAGKCDEQYHERINRLNDSGVIVYHGLLSDTSDLYKMIHCLVLPTYHPEGISNVLLEAAACGRPAICTSRTGCKEVITDKVNGLYCKEKDSEDLIRVIDAFCSLSYEKKKEMGKNGRKKVEKEFSRKLVIEQYLKVLEEIK